MPEPNDLLRAARERTHLTRDEVAGEVVRWLAEHDSKGREAPFDAGHLGKLERGTVRRPRSHYVAALCAVLGANEAELGFAESPPPQRTPPTGPDELAALELARRVAASDLGDETLTRLEQAFDDLATAYPVTPPTELLSRLRNHLSYVAALMDSRATLAQRTRLIAIGGWLSLLAATVHIDLTQHAAATARLRTAASLARHAGHDEIRAWCFETEAWRVLTDGDYHHAVELTRAAQALAPAGSSAEIQATAQEGRAWARLHQPRETYDAIDQVDRLASSLARPDRPEHHYRYDPNKSVAYMATTLAWVGDPAAESHARDVIARFTPIAQAGRWPRRLAVANLDLALSLLVTDRLDEACGAAQRAIASGQVVPSNHWRAAEVVAAVEARQLPEAPDLRDAYEQLRRGGIESS